ncbi:hypothetical protein IW150_007111, partial [Coemansia sp. RSA 2607]
EEPASQANAQLLNMSGEASLPLGVDKNAQTTTTTTDTAAADTSLDNNSRQIANISAAIEAMCGNSSQSASRQRTASWVSSELSSQRGALTENQTARHSHTNSVEGNIPTATGESRRQHVRLTTIDPITASINVAIDGYRDSADIVCSEDDLDP